MIKRSPGKKVRGRSAWIQYFVHTLVTIIFIVIISSDRSSCTDDGLLYIRGGGAAATFSDFEHLCLSILLQVSL